MREAILLELQLERAHEVQLFSDNRLAAEDLELQICVRKADDRVACCHDGTVLNQDLFDPAAFDRIEIHRAARDQPATQGDKVLEGADRHLGHRDAFRVDAERAAGQQCADQPAHEQEHEQPGDAVHYLAA